MSSMKRIVLKDIVTQKDVTLLAGQRDWLWWEEYPQTEQQPYEKIWITEDEKTSIHYIEDFVVGLNYIMIKGAAVNEISEIINKMLGTYSETDIKSSLNDAKTTEDTIKAINHIAVTASEEYNEEVFKLFEQALEHKDSEVRKATIMGMGYPGWHEFKALLEKLQQSDTDEEVRKHAGFLLEGYDALRPQ